MRLPQGSVGYAVARISVMRRERLDAAKLDRLLSTGQPQEAFRALQEIGWGSADQGADYEQLTAEHMRNACAFVRESSPDHHVTDCFLLRYDVQNLKMLIKARCQGQEAAYLSPCGTLPMDLLRHAVAEGYYKRLPEAFWEPLAALEKRLSMHEDPMDIDVTLDRALYAMVFDHLRHVRSTAVRRYFVSRADMTNALIVLRVRAMGRPLTFLKQVLIEGGTIPLTRWADAHGHEESIVQLLAPYGRHVTAAAEAALGGALPGLERAMDDYLLSLFYPYRAKSDAIETIVGYLLAQEREAAAVRLVMAGKLNGFSAEAIRERLRELYV